MIGTVKLYKPYMNSRKRMVKAMAKIAKQLTELIGNTPLLELTNYEKENELEANLIVKLEYFNPLGSVKDRVAHAMIEQGIADGKINSDTVIIEPTSGGMTICIEPMINMGTWKVWQDERDGWTIRTMDGKPAAHYENTVLITEDGVEILTL